MTKYSLILLLAVATGCSVSPIPPNRSFTVNRDVPVTVAAGFSGADTSVAIRFPLSYERDFKPQRAAQSTLDRAQVMRFALSGFDFSSVRNLKLYVVSDTSSLLLSSVDTIPALGQTEYELPLVKDDIKTYTQDTIVRFRLNFTPLTSLPITIGTRSTITFIAEPL